MRAQPSSAPQGVGHRPKTEEASWTPQGWKEARRAEKEPRRGDLSPEGAGAAAERLVIYKSTVQSNQTTSRKEYYFPSLVA